MKIWENSFATCPVWPKMWSVHGRGDVKSLVFYEKYPNLQNERFLTNDNEIR